MVAKLDIGRVFNRIFEYYTGQAAIYLPAALILFLPAALITGAVVSGGASLLLLIISIAVGLITAFLYQGVVVESVRDLQDGHRDQSLGSLFASVPPVLGALIAVGILGGIAEAIGFVLLIVPGCILITIWAVVAPVVVVERKSPLEAFGRSRQLVRGNGWQVFGVLVVLFLLQVVVGRIVAGIGGDSFIVAALLQLIVNVLVAPLGALAAAVMYFELLSRGSSVQPIGGPGAAPLGHAPMAPQAGTPSPQQPPSGRSRPGSIPPPG
ncbi:MAG: hypothetical protein M3Z33_13250 [Actinomycetota bacterium]|nr:hypothetical protein [Actinomycetota bacterium]